MKRIGFVVMAAVLTGAGCLALPEKAADPRPQPAPAPPPVTADGVTEHNAAEVARALRAELERERGRAEGEAGDGGEE